MSTKKVKTETMTVTNETSLITLAEKGQEGIPQMLEIIKDKIEQITRGAVMEESTKGRCLSGFDEISSINSVCTLIQAHSSVTGKANAYKVSAEILGMDIKKYPFKLDDCTEKQWVDDIQARVIILDNQKQLNKLRATQKLLEENLSQEAKLKNDLAKVAAMLTDDTALE